MIENDLIFFETKIKIKINFYKFTGGDLDHLKDQVQLKDLDLFHQDQLILNNPDWEITLNSESSLYIGFVVRLLQGVPSGQIAGLGWLLFMVFHLQPGSAWADGKLAEVAEQLGQMVEHHRSKSTQLSNQMDHPVFCVMKSASFH